MTKRSLRFLLPLLLGAIVLPAVPAEAAVTSDFSGGVLTVTGGGADDTILVNCVTLAMKVNGADPDGPVACAAVTTVRVNGGGGDDHLTVDNLDMLAIVNGQDGNDTFSTDGATTMNGGPGNDDLRGSKIEDILKGGSGNDFIEPFDGNDTINGGKGTDKVMGYGQDFWRLTDTKLEGEGIDSLKSIEKAELEGTADDTMNATGFSGKALLQGEDGADTLTGGSGNDNLQGSTGDDTIKGGAGNDRLDGGPDTDTCSGGPGTDHLLNCE